MRIELKMKIIKQIKKNIKKYKRIKIEEKKNNEEKNIENKKTEKAL